MGEVFVAKVLGAAGFQKRVVIKKILPHLVEHQQFVDGLVREAKLLVMLDHPNIVQVLDLGRDGTDYFMAMEFVHGYNMATVAHYCAQKRLLIPANACAYIGLHVLSGLDYAHSIKGADGSRYNIIHRDVSPQNVLLSRDGRVKLTDFGIAKVLNEAEAEVTKSLKGKFRYMAPEAVDGGRIDHRYDLFAAGILIFEALCRRHLFGGRSDVDILNQVRETKIPPITRYHPNAPPALIKVVERALMRSADDRYQTAAEFAADLRTAIRPITEIEAGVELRDFIADLYARPDFPINKPKLNDLDAPDPNVTRSVVLADIGDSGAPGTGVRPRKAAGNALLWSAIVVIGAAVIFLAYALLLRDQTSQPGNSKGPVIIRVQPKTPDVGVTVAAPPADLGSMVAQADAKVDKRQRTVNKLPPAIRFTENVGRKAFARSGAKISACVNKHAKNASGVSMRVISTIRSNGRVASVKIEPAVTDKAPLGRCIKKVAKRIRYPRHNQPTVTFSQPLTFKLR